METFPFLTCVDPQIDDFIGLHFDGGTGLNLK
jgi:hypothetical protein